jgi:tricorn protease
MILTTVTATRRFLPNILSRGSILLILLAAMSTLAAAQTKAGNTRLLRYPDIHGDRVVFTYGGDLWEASRSGGLGRRLTSHPGEELFAKFSPDGKWIAFSGEYDGNLDVYVMPVDGGEPRRLTYHPAPDLVLGWTPDSKSVLFRSTRTSFSTRFDKLFTVSIEGGLEEELPLPAGGLTSFSPDGTKVAYNRVSTEFRTWKRYRGGWHQFVSIYDLKNNKYDEVPHTEAADEFPMWYGDSIYFDSDRDGAMNLYKYDLKTKTIRQLTHYNEYDVKWPSLGGGDAPAIVYENGGYLYSLDLKSEKTALIPVVVESDESLIRPSFVKVEKFIDSFSLSPSGARALFEARGEVFTVPAKKGDIRNITGTSGVRETSPAWSPDGKWIAYLSDRTGEYELYIRPQDGTGEEKRITTDGHTFRNGVTWSPDSTKVLFWEKTLKLFYVDISDGKPVMIDQSPVSTIQNYDWSPDSKWVVYAKNGENGFGRIHLYSMDQKKSFAVTDGMTNDRDPVFDKGGKYIYFLSDRNFNPGPFTFELNLNITSPTGIYAVTLAADTISPFAPESDEEKGAASDPSKPDGDPGEGPKPGEKPSDQKAGSGSQEGPKDGAQPAANGQPAAKEKSAKPAAKPVKIDLENIGARIVKVPVPPGIYRGLLAAKDRIFFTAIPLSGNNPGVPAGVLHTYDVAKREDTPLLAGIGHYDIDAKGDKVIYSAGPVFAQFYGIIDVKPGQKVGDGKLELSGMEMKLDPRAEWKQMFNEAWRIERDFYYDPTMRGLDWAAIKARYEQELPYVADRSDLNYLIGEMIAELSTSHAYVGGGDGPDAKKVAVGLLGTDFELADGHYRFKKIYAGDNSDNTTRSPLTEPGINVREGEYLLAVNGRSLSASDNPLSFFENTVGKQITLKVNAKPTEAGARLVTVRPIPNDTALRYLDWVEGNRRKVAEATGGRCGYMHVPDTQFSGMQAFAKAFYPQTDKDAMIVDERWNSGGFIPDFFTERLRRKLLNYVAPRDGRDQQIPGAAIYGPKVMLINEFAGSGGDAFPYYFRQEKIGPLIGKRTWGGLVGISVGLGMVDGGFVTAPSVAFWGVENGKSEWIVENKGVSPDIDIDARPDLIVSGHDPQLEKAIEVIKEELAKNPPPHPSRPAYGPARAARQ